MIAAIFIGLATTTKECAHLKLALVGVAISEIMSQQQARRPEAKRNFQVVRKWSVLILTISVGVGTFVNHSSIESNWQLADLAKEALPMIKEILYCIAVGY